MEPADSKWYTSGIALCVIFQKIFFCRGLPLLFLSSTFVLVRREAVSFNSLPSSHFFLY